MFSTCLSGVGIYIWVGTPIVVNGIVWTGSVVWLYIGAIISVISVHVNGGLTERELSNECQCQGKK